MKALRPAAATVLVLGLLAASTPQVAAADGPEVIARTGVLKTRPAGMPSAGAADSQRIESARVTQDIEGYRVKATVVLHAAPGPGATLAVGFGAADGTACVSEATYTTPTTGTPSAGFSVSGRTVTLDGDSVDARVGDWNCAFVATGSPDDTTYDALIGDLKDVHAKPTLKVGAVELLDREQKRLRLVPKAWTPLEVTVSNPGRYQAFDVKLAGSGKSVKIRGAKVGWLNRGGKAVARVQVKLTRKTATTLKLVARSGGAKAVRKIKVAPVKAPRRPAAGSYSTGAKPGKITFKVAGGKVKAFKARGVRMTCRAPGEVGATYRLVNLNFPKAVKVPSNGIVDVLHEWSQGNAWYRARLQMRIDGPKVMQGNFNYVTADWCRVDTDFTARR